VAEEPAGLLAAVAAHAVTVRGRPGRRAEWQHVADRIEALDGELAVDTSDAGTVLQAVVPLAVAAPGVG
jgi:hypothetical protein